MPEMVRAVGRLERGPLSVPIRVGSAIPHQSEEIMMFRRKHGGSPSAFERTLCEDDPGVHAEQLFRFGGTSRQVCKKLIFLSIIYRYLFVFQIDNDYIYIL